MRVVQITFFILALYLCSALLTFCNPNNVRQSTAKDTLMHKLEENYWDTIIKYTKCVQNKEELTEDKIESLIIKK